MQDRPEGVEPSAACPDDDADRDQDDEEDALAVPGFGSSPSIAGAGSGGAWWNSIDTSGGVHGRAGPGADDVVPVFGGGGSGIGGGSNEVSGLGSDGSGFGGGVGGGSGLIANAGGRPNGPSMSALAALDHPGPCVGQQGGDRGLSARRRDIRSRWTFGREAWAWPAVGVAQAELAGAVDIE
jgi:hypothetical protein